MAALLSMSHDLSYFNQCTWQETRAGEYIFQTLFYFYPNVKVLAFHADYGLERLSGKNRTQYQHYRRHIRLVVRDVGHSPASSSGSVSGSAYVQPGRTIQFQRIFDLPHRLTPSTGAPIIRRRPLNLQRHLTDSSADVTTSSSVLERGTVRLDKESLISVKYFCKVILILLI